MLNKEKQVVIFGADKLAEVAEVHLTDDSCYEVAAFTVDEKYLNGRQDFLGKNLVPFEDLFKTYPADHYEIFVAVGRNRSRAQVYDKCRQSGYKLAQYIDSSTPLRRGLTVGDNVFILGMNNIDPYVKIGNNTITWGGNHLGHHGRIGNNVFIASGVTIAGGCEIGDGSYIAIGANIADGVKIAPSCFIGMGASISRDTNPGEVYGHGYNNKLEINIDHRAINKYL